MFDIHSHILPNIDDGAQSIKESIKLLELMRENNISHVMATPHFYPDAVNLDEYLSSTNSSFNLLKERTKGKNLPNIYLGCELLYYDSIGYSSSLSSLCLNNSNYLLLELSNHCINEKLFENLNMLINKVGIIPIIAHIERYYKAKNFKKLLSFVIENKIPIQVNATSFFIFQYKRTLKKLLTSKAFIVLGTDTHSSDFRPPLLKDALCYIEKKFGNDIKDMLLQNNAYICKKIIG